MRVAHYALLELCPRLLPKASDDLRPTHIMTMVAREYRNQPAHGHGWALYPPQAHTHTRTHTHIHARPAVAAACYLCVHLPCRPCMCRSPHGGGWTYVARHATSPVRGPTLGRPPRANEGSMNNCRAPASGAKHIWYPSRSRTFSQDVVRIAGSMPSRYGCQRSTSLSR